MGYTIIGGKLGPAIDLTIEGRLPVSFDQVRANMESAGRLSLPPLPEANSPSGRCLAVVGGGPSINRPVIIEGLKALDRSKWDIWAINGAFGWCQKHDIEATFFALDPHEIVATWCKGAKRAILADCCDPSVFHNLSDARTNDGWVCWIETIKTTGLPAGSSTATAAPYLAAKMGYGEVSFLGCESSFQPESTHAYGHEERQERLIVCVDGIDHLTALDYFMQAHELSSMIAELPDFLSEESGGLLRAMTSAKLKAKASGEKPEDHWFVKWIDEGCGLERPSTMDQAIATIDTFLRAAE